jgi:hypothetical protein
VLARLGGTSGSCRSSSGFQVLDIFVNLLLQLPELLQGTFGEHGKVAGSAGQNLIAIGFKDTLHSLPSRYNVYGAFANRPRLLPSKAHFGVSGIPGTWKFPSKSVFEH